ncbi:sodium:solute symporter family transporter [Streptomyces peucetius]|uniref:Cation acetate symporter n=1 Tax=Streptomyces peucetius TaxID=1950 RepID=A0ABY6I3W5_STRPE|nr:cation acetate symporter [Streptomyces peucetius]UYQ61583.1 cation acetate symporter [Streptomyces peucetius]
MSSHVHLAGPVAQGSGFEGRSLALVVFLAFVTVSLLLCGLAAADQDDPEHFYAGGAALGPAGGGLAVAGDYVSAATLLSTTGSVALAGADGILFALATVVSLVLVMLVLARPLRGSGIYTLGDFIADRLADRSVRRPLGIASLVVLFPLLVVQLSTAGKIMTAMFDLPPGALTGCTVASGALMVCYSAFGGMRGTGYIQILKTFVVVAVVVLLAGLVLDRFGWSPVSLFDAARQGSGRGGSYALPGLQFGHGVAGWLDLTGFLLTLVIGAACMPHITMRLHPMRGARTVRRAAGWAVAPVALLCAGVVVIGLGAAALVGHKHLQAADPGGNTALLMVTTALDPGAGGPGHSLLFAVVACAVFATTLSTVAGITLAAASSFARDLAGPSGGGSRGHRSTAGEVRLARWAVATVGAAAVFVSTQTYGRNPQVLLAFAFAAAASVLPPVLLYAIFRRHFTAAGVRWAVYGTLPLVTVLMACSPAASGTPISLFPDRDFHWFPLQTPGLVTVPAGFLLALAGSGLLRRRPVPPAVPHEQKKAHAEWAQGR